MKESPYIFVVRRMPLNLMLESLFFAVEAAAAVQHDVVIYLYVLVKKLIH